MIQLAGVLLALFAVGDNRNYTLGFLSPEERTEFALVDNRTFRAVETNRHATFAIEESGLVYAMGRNA